ncbi:hypothetical protein [Paenibacillus lentus]|uniref:hypothetical protein n=1 Tax=Paenibacillus lentus TaxID=1338368 RepID=UPI001B861B28|nr:hypothetical protein [Paenibacillus lentus]
MIDIILILVICILVVAAVVKIVIEKKRGAKCIGCPSSGAGKQACPCSPSKDCSMEESGNSLL